MGQGRDIPRPEKQAGEPAFPLLGLRVTRFEENSQKQQEKIKSVHKTNG